MQRCRHVSAQSCRIVTKPRGRQQQAVIDARGV